jgi:hypothetical protein
MFKNMNEQNSFDQVPQTEQVPQEVQAGPENSELMQRAIAVINKWPAGRAGETISASDLLKLKKKF